VKTRLLRPTLSSLTCTDVTRPDDRWEFIVETFEFLPNAD